MSEPAPMVMFTVFGEPVPKARPRVVGAHTYTPARTRAHERLIWACAVKAKVRPFTGPVAVALQFHMSRPDRCDVDNLAKTVLDALIGTAYVDDRQVVELHASKHHDPANQRTNVEIRAMPAR